MKRSIFVVAVAVSALALPATAGADVYNGNDCTYAQDEQADQTVPVGSGTVTVYADADGGGGMTGTAFVSGGACANDLNLATDAGTLQGGTVEAGAADPRSGSAEAYAIVDGDNQNIDPSRQSDGYIGLSNYETSTLDGSCDGGGDGSNSGGCVGVDGVGQFDVPVPLACGNTTGNIWADTGRDGCSIP